MDESGGGRSQNVSHNEPEKEDQGKTGLEARFPRNP